jgi:hypothetical protein
LVEVVGYSHFSPWKGRKHRRSMFYPQSNYTTFNNYAWFVV